MELAGIVDLVLLVVVIVYVYPVAKTQLRKVLGKSALTTVVAVGVSVAVLKYGTQFSNDFLKESGKKGEEGMASETDWREQEKVELADLDKRTRAAQQVKKTVHDTIASVSKGGKPVVYDEHLHKVKI